MGDSINKYEIGTPVCCNKVNGVVVENFKLPGDICISWESGMITSYDEEWLDENVEVRD